MERRSLKKSGLQRDSNPWPPRFRCDALPTELWNHTLGARSIYWVHIFPCSEMMWSLYEIIHICTSSVLVSYILDYDKICKRNELKKILDCGLWKQAWVEKRGKCSSVVIVLWNAYDGKIQQLRVSIPPISLPLPLHALPKKQLSLKPS